MIQNWRGTGERALVRHILGILGEVVEDDCAIIDIGDEYIVATTDMLHRKTDFPEPITPWQMGWMTVAVNLSDIAAMGARPLGLLIATGIPRTADLAFVSELVSGIRDCAEAYGTVILGGDLDSHDELTLVGSALGCIEKDLVIRRRGARVGDLLCTTGFLGSAGAGLRLLQEGVGAENELTRKLLEPVPRLSEGRALAKSRSVTSMMDNSDGLALSLYDLAEASGVGFVVEEDLLPMLPAVRDIARDETDLLDLLVHSGGDFELLFTVKPDGINSARGACSFTVVGRAVEKGIWLESSGTRREIVPAGYEHRIFGP